MKHLTLACALGLSLGIPAIMSLPANACTPHPDNPSGCDKYNNPRFPPQPDCPFCTIKPAPLENPYILNPILSDPTHTDYRLEQDAKLPSAPIDQAMFAN